MKRRKGVDLIGFFLWTGAVGWGVAILGVLLPWRVIGPLLLQMGAQSPVADPQLQYWLRMAAGAWSIIGFFFFVAARDRKRHTDLPLLLGAASLFEGALLLVHGLILGRPLLPFAADVIFCFFVGAGLLYGLIRR